MGNKTIEKTKVKNLIGQMESKSEYFDSRHKFYLKDNPNNNMAYYFLGRKNTIDKTIQTIKNELNC